MHTHVAQRKSPTRLQYLGNFTFFYQSIFLNAQKLSDLVWITVRENVFWESKQFFFSSVNILSLSVWTRHSRKFTSFSVFGLLCTPIKVLTVLTCRCLNLFHWNFATTCFVSQALHHVILGLALVTVQCINSSELESFPWAEPELLEIEGFIVLEQ